MTRPSIARRKTELRSGPTADLVAGLSAAGLMLPEAIAYSAIAGLPAIAGLTAAIVGGLAYLVLGRSRQAIVSPTSSAAVLLAASIAALGQTSTNAAAALTILVGLIFLFLALVQAGSFAGFVSRPVLRGFAFGLAVTIVIGQLPHIAGVEVVHGSIAMELGELASRSAQFSLASLALGCGALALLLVLRRFRSIPAALIVLVTGMIFNAVLGLSAHGVQTVAPIKVALPTVANPFSGLQDFSRLAQLAVPIAFILFAESWTTIRNMALRHGDTANANREIAALGIANIASGLAHGMPVGAGFSIGSANEQAGARSRLAAGTASLAILGILVVYPGLVSQIPLPVLAAIVIGALIHALSPAPLKSLLALKRDYSVSIVAALGVLFLGVLDGMLLAIAMSVGLVLRRFAKPFVSQLGRVPEQPHDFVDLSQHEDATSIPGIAIFRPNAPLFFANVEAVLARIRKDAAAVGSSWIVLSLEETDDLDSTAIEALGEFLEALRKDGNSLVLARLHDRAREGLKLAHSPLAGEGTFSVADAVQFAQNQLTQGDRR